MKFIIFLCRNPFVEYSLCSLKKEEKIKGMGSRKKSRGTSYYKENINKTMLAYTY